MGILKGEIWCVCVICVFQDENFFDSLKLGGAWFPSHWYSWRTWNHSLHLTHTVGLYVNQCGNCFFDNGVHECTWIICKGFINRLLYMYRYFMYSTHLDNLYTYLNWLQSKLCKRRDYSYWFQNCLCRNCIITPNAQAFQVTKKTTSQSPSLEHVKAVCKAKYVYESFTLNSCFIFPSKTKTYLQFKPSICGIKRCLKPT